MEEFRQLYERHYEAVYRLALFLTGSPDRAEDVASDTFVRAWTARDRIRYATVRAYLLTITRNLYTAGRCCSTPSARCRTQRSRRAWASASTP